VFCEEDGAFVYPNFAVDKLPIQCSPRYFIKLSECSGSFSSMFHIQHGDPQLCRYHYQLIISSFSQTRFFPFVA